METLPVTVITESEAREMARELATESLADIPHLRYSLSALTSMGAQLAHALEQRNREYEALLVRVALLPEEWLDLAPGTRLPDLGQLRADLAQVTAERDAAAAQLAARETLLEDLQKQLEAAQKRVRTASQASNKKQAVLEKSLSQAVSELAGLQTRIADAEQARAGLAQDLGARQQELGDARARIANLESELVQALAARAELDEQLATREMVLSDLNHQIARQQELLQAILPADLILPEEDQAPQLAGIVALAAMVERVTEASKTQAATLVELEDQVNGLAADKASLEASLQEQEAALAAAQQQVQALQGTVDDLNAQIQALQVDRNNASAEKDELQQTLAKREGELVAARQQVAALEAQVEASEALLQDLQGKASELQAQIETEAVELAELRSRDEATRFVEARSALALALENRPAFKRNAASAALVAGAEPQLVLRLQDLSKVTGIGAARRRRLYAHGIGTFWELAHTSDEELLQFLELGKTQASTFDFAAARAEAFELARATGTQGWIWEGLQIDDFETMAGIGSAYEQRLYEHGICTYQQLASVPEEELALIIDAPEMRQPNYAGWIAEAQALADQQREAAVAAAQATVQE